MVLPGNLTLKAAAASGSGSLERVPVYHFLLTIAGEGVLPTRRWVRAAW